MPRLPRAQRHASAKTPRAKSTIEVEHQGRVYRGRGVSTDTVEASARAFLNAINRIAAKAGRPKIVTPAVSAVT